MNVFLLVSLFHVLSVAFAEDLVPRIGKIVNGFSTHASEYPFIASLIVYYPKFGYSSYSFCGGSLLRKEYPAVVLTAGHCLINFDSRDELRVDLHRSDIDAFYSSSNNYARYNALGYIVHSDYNETFIDNDVALIFLDADLTNEDYLQVVSIPDLSNLNGNECCNNDDALDIVGYGADFQGGPTTDTLEYSHKRFIDRYQCNHKLTEYTINTYYGGIIEYSEDTDWVWSFVTKNMICAIGDNTDTCQGDSGGPLLRADSNEQVGIVSWGFGCNNDIPGVYTNVGVYYEWINTHLEVYSGHDLPDLNNEDNDIVGSVFKPLGPISQGNKTMHVQLISICVVMMHIIFALK